MAGVWDVDIELASFQIGEKYKLSELLTVFEGRFFFFDDNKKMFVIDFIKFQYGEELNEKSPVHRKIISLLKSYKIENDSLYDRVLNSLFTRIKAKEEEKEEEEEKEGAVKKQKAHLFADSKFIDLEIFEAQFSGTDYEYCDLKIYHEKVKNWSASGGNKKIDWIATARNFMLGDKEKGKLILKDGTKQVSQSEQSAGNAVNEYLKQQYAGK